MTVSVRVRNAGDKRDAEVDPFGFIRVVDRDLPPFGKEQRGLPFVDRFKNEAGSDSMVIPAPGAGGEDFVIQPSQRTDRWVVSILFFIEGSGPNVTLSQFGGAAPLSVGFDFGGKIEGSERLLFSGLVRNFDFVRTAMGQPAFGTGANAFQAVDTIGNNTLAYIPVIDFRRYGMPHGVRLPRASAIEFFWRVNDATNVAGVDTVFSEVSGFERFPDDIETLAES